MPRLLALACACLFSATAVAAPQKLLTAATIRRVTPYFVLAFVLGLVTVVFQAGNSIADVVVRPEGFTSRLAAAGWVVWFHLSKALVPLALSPLYPRWVVDPANPAAYAPLVMLGLVVLLLWLMRKRVTAWPLVGLLAYIALLFPTLGFLDIGFFIYALVADHWQYVAIPAIAAGFGWCAGRLTTPPAVRSVGIVLCAAWLVALSILARDYARAFESPKAFWSRAVELDPTVWKAHIGLGSALVAEGDTVAGRKYLQEAIKLRPDNSEAHANLGVAYAMDEQLGDAYTHLRRAIELDPKRREARISLAAVCAGSGRDAEAIEHYDVALSNNPESVSVMLRLSSLLAESTNTAARNPARAVELSRSVVQLAPDAWVARESLARALRSFGDVTNAVGEASRAASIADEVGQSSEAARIRAEFGL